MDMKIQKAFQDQFDALATLKKTATKTEMEFYTQAEAVLKESYEQMAKPPSVPTEASLQAKYKRIYEHILYLEFERNSDSLGNHWNYWAQTEITFFQQRLEKVIQGLQEMGSNIDSILISPMTQETYEESVKVESIAVRLEELRILLGLKISRLQQRGISEAEINENTDIQNLQVEIRTLENSSLT